jgi:hypothetical protein
MRSDIDAKWTSKQLLSITAIVCLSVAGIVGYFVGYYKGQQDLRSQVRDAFQHALAVSDAASSPPTLDGNPPEPPEPVWDVDESKSPIDDSPTVALSIAASKAPLNTVGVQQSARLMIRCKEHRTDLYVALDEYLGTETSTVVYRIDDAPSQTDRWSNSTDGKAAFADDPVALARKLSSAKKFFVRMSDFQGTPYDVEFKTPGLAKYLPKVAAACAWK